MAKAMEAGAYVTPSAADPFPAQPESALAVIRAFMGPVPALLLGAAIAFALVYPLRREAAPNPALAAEAGSGGGGR